SRGYPGEWGWSVTHGAQPPRRQPPVSTETKEKTMIRKSTLTITAAAAALALGLTACGGNTQSDDTAMGGEVDETGSPTEDDSATEESEPQESADETFGSECSEIPDEGEGSLGSMAEEPVATAISQSSMLSTLGEMLDQAELVDTLDSEDELTVFAPTDAAFDQMSDEEMDSLQEDQQQLTDFLNHHVVEGIQEPTDLEDGSFTSLQGTEVTTQGSDEEFTVDDEAQIVCGNVQTSNATIYMIDKVLSPTECSRHPCPRPPGRPRPFSWAGAARAFPLPACAGTHMGVRSLLTHA